MTKPERSEEAPVAETEAPKPEPVKTPAAEESPAPASDPVKEVPPVDAVSAASPAPAAAEAEIKAAAEPAPAEPSPDPAPERTPDAAEKLPGAPAEETSSVTQDTAPAEAVPSEEKPAVDAAEAPAAPAAENVTAVTETLPVPVESPAGTEEKSATSDAPEKPEGGETTAQEAPAGTTESSENAETASQEEKTETAPEENAPETPATEIPAVLPVPVAPAPAKPVIPGIGRLGGFLGALSVLALLAAVLDFAAVTLADWPAFARVGLFGVLGLAALVPVLFVKRLSAGALDTAGTLWGLMTGCLIAAAAVTWPSGESAAALVLVWAAVLTPWLLVFRRPVYFSLWFVVVLAALVLQGMRLAMLDDPLTELLPAAAFTALVTIVTSLVTRWKRPSTVLRAAALVPSFATALLLGVVPGSALALQASHGSEVTVALFGLLYLLAAAALLVSGRPELRAAAILGAAAWLNGVILSLLPGFASSEIALYALTLVNGLLCLGWTLVAARLRARRMAEADAGEEGDYARIAGVAPRAVGALLGGVSVLLLAATVTSFLSPDPVVTGGLLLGAGLVIELVRRWKARSTGTSSGFSVVSLIALLLAFAGWFVFGVLGAASLPEGGTALLAVVIALVFHSRTALVLALLSPWLGANGNPLMNPVMEYFVIGTAALAALLAAAVAWLPEGRVRREALHWLPAPVLAAAVNPVVPGILVGRNEILQNPVCLAISFAALLLVGAAWAARSGLSLPRVILLVIGLALPAAAFPAASAVTLAFAAAASALLANRLTPGLLLLTFLVALGMTWNATPLELPGVVIIPENLTVALASLVCGLGFMAAALALRVPDPAAPQGRALTVRPLAAVLFLATLAATFSWLTPRLDLIDSGERFVAAVSARSEADTIVGEALTLRYELDTAVPRTARDENDDARAAAPRFLCAASSEGKLALLGTAQAASACPAGTAVALKLDLYTGLPRLPRVSLLTGSADEKLSETVKSAELRCASGRCVLTRLLDAEGRAVGAKN
ncbi:hypothetical protein [Sutterella sp.]|uniref:hypothetical protein n=1 Tax=Sutterella sp. TaxID=1981025 RepID=UPI0026E08475|nr:hypothetical protein [Sutterella sp.]MDO5531703.1 hypothetical protein [Sutterella sp.]